MNTNWILGAVFIASGLFSLIASIKDWDFFFRSLKTKWIANIIGRNGARAFYGILGFVLIIVGVLAFLGTVDLAADFQRGNFEKFDFYNGRI